MKTKKIILTLLLLTGSISIFAQLNPIKNLSFSQHDNYMVSFNCQSANCFRVSWNKPNISSDTLVGYNVYRNDILFAFTTDTIVQCWGNAPCLYPGFFENIFPSWVTVKAIYNSDSLKSIANDSIHVYSIAIGIKEYNREKLNVLKNPIRIGENISLFIPINDCNKNTIIIFSQDGQLIKQYNMVNNAGNIINISTNQLHSGIYLIDLMLDKKTFTTKLIIE